MKFVPKGLGQVTEVLLDRHEDHRGWFARAMCVDEFAAAGLETDWVQVNQAFNPKTFTLRGIHLQEEPHAEAKFIRCVSGRIYDVAVDLRPGSATHGSWVAAELTASAGNGLYIPPGFGHGYQTLEPNTSIIYWTNRRFRSESATGVRYDAPELRIDWPAPPGAMSDADRNWPALSSDVT